MDEVIRVDGLTKTFGSFVAVDNISFSVHEQEIFGILGPNGAGKTTTLEIIEGLQRPTTGSTYVMGADSRYDTAKVKERLGVQLQASAYFEYLTLQEILSLFGSFYQQHIEPRELLDKVSLLDKAGTTLKKLSGGQKQRFTVAASLVNDPKVVILDEPTTGLDPQARRSLWQLIQQINDEGKTIVLTTHYMEEAQALCNRIAIMDKGSIVALDTTDNLLQSLGAPYVLKMVPSRPLSPEEAQDLAEWSKGTLIPDGTTLQLRVQNTAQSLTGVLEWTQQRDIALEHLEVVASTLEDLFIELTGKDLRD